MKKDGSYYGQATINIIVERVLDPITNELRFYSQNDSEDVKLHEVNIVVEGLSSYYAGDSCTPDGGSEEILDVYIDEDDPLFTPGYKITLTEQESNLALELIDQAVQDIELKDHFVTGED